MSLFTGMAMFGGQAQVISTIFWHCSDVVV